MSGALLRFVLWRHKVAFVACWIVPVLLSLAVGLIYPTYAKEQAAIKRLLRLFEPILGEEATELISPAGFLLIPFHHPITLLLLAIFASVAPLALPAGDRGRGTLDLLLSTALSRRALARTMLAVIGLGAATFGWAPYFGVQMAARMSGFDSEIPGDMCVLVALNAGALVAALGATALLCSATAEDGGAATARFVGFVVVTLALDLLSRAWKSGRSLRWATLLGYYRPQDLVAYRLSPWVAIGVLVGYACVAYAAAEWVLRTRRRA
jgi:hypothetical protein